MTLHEALKVVENSQTPGAITEDGVSYVFFDDEQGMFGYIPDILARRNELSNDLWWLEEEQLDRLVPGARSDVWTPVSNYVF